MHNFSLEKNEVIQHFAKAVLDREIAWELLVLLEWVQTPMDNDLENMDTHN